MKREGIRTGRDLRWQGDYVRMVWKADVFGENFKEETQQIMNKFGRRAI
jgi:hypothetical protein